MKLFKIKTWPVATTMIVVPALIIGIYGTIILLAVYFQIPPSEDSMQFSLCVFELDCTHAELGLYSLMGGMVFALSWAIAYSVHSAFPKNLALLLFGAIIAAPFYGYGISGFSKLAPPFENGGGETSLLELSLMGVFGAAFHVFGAALMIRLLRAFMKFRSNRNAKG